MKKTIDAKKYYITLFIVAVLTLLLGMTALATKSEPMEGQFGCSFNNIEYTDVRPHECWLEDVDPEFCPLPHDMKCEGDFGFPVSVQMLSSIVTEMTD